MPQFSFISPGDKVPISDRMNLLIWNSSLDEKAIFLGVRACVCACVRTCIIVHVRVCILVSCLGTDAETGREPAAFVLISTLLPDVGYGGTARLSESYSIYKRLNSIHAELVRGG